MCYFGNNVVRDHAVAEDTLYQRMFSHLKSATVYHSTFVDKNVQWYNDK